MKRSSLQGAGGNKSATIFASGSQYFSLDEGSSISIVGANGTVGVATLLGNAGQTVQQWAIGAGALAPIGQYTGEQRFLVTCSAGRVDVAVNASAALTPMIVVSSAAPNNADGRPDGTIYIQTAP